MKEEEMQIFFEVLNKTSEVFAFKLTRGALSVWWSIFKKYPLGCFKVAMKSCISDTSKCGSFMPKPADVLRFLENSDDELAIYAWESVKKAIRIHGSYESIVFFDKKIHAVIDGMGGWERLCMLDQQVFPFAEKEFISRYLMFLKNNNEEFPSVLLGKIDRQNSSLGVEIRNPVFVNCDYLDNSLSIEEG